MPDLPKALGSAITLPGRLLAYATRRRPPCQVLDSSDERRTVHIDVTRIAERDIRTGIQRTVRQLSRHWYPLQDRRVRLNFVKVSRDGVLEHAWDWAREVIPGFKPECGGLRPVMRKGDVLLLLDLVLPPRGLNLHQLRSLRNGGVQIGVMVYDLLPLSHRRFFQLSTVLAFSKWLQRIRLANYVFTISRESSAAIRSYLQRRIKPNHFQGKICLLHLSGEPECHLRETHSERSTDFGPAPLFVCIGTLEPRKRYEEVLNGFDLYWRKGGPGSLWIFAQPGWKTKELQRRIRVHPELNRRLRWFKGSDDSEVWNALEHAASLIANSKAEGLGLPILEANFLSVPLILRDIPVFRGLQLESVRWIPDDDANSSSLANLLNLEPHFARSPRSKTGEAMWRWADSARELEDFLELYES